MEKYKFQKFENNKLIDLDIDAKTLDGNGTSGFVGNVSITENSAIGDQITITKVDGTTNNITIKNAYHSTNSDQLGGKNASEYLTGITKDQVITALGYTPLQSETKKYQHNIRINFPNGYVIFSFINNSDLKLTNFLNLVMAVLQYGGTGLTLSASGQVSKNTILTHISAINSSTFSINGVDLSSQSLYSLELTSAYTITDFVVTI